MNPIVKLALPYVVGAVVLSGGVAWYNHVQQEKGALKFQLAAEHARNDTLAAVADTARRKAAGAEVRFDSLTAVAAVRERRLRVAQVVTDTARARLASARDSLAAAIADSLATIAQLRDAGQRMIARSDSAEAAHQRERFVADSTIAAGKRALTFVTDSLKAAYAKALKAQEDATAGVRKELSTLQKAMPSTAARWIERGASLGIIAYFASRK